MPDIEAVTIIYHIVVLCIINNTLVVNPLPFYTHVNIIVTRFVSHTCHVKQLFPKFLT